MPDTIRVEVVFATAKHQRLVELEVPNGCRVRDALERSELATHFPEIDLGALEVGIWGRVVPRDQLLKDGDRVEVYRPLELDPREARRRLAAAGRTMGRPGGR